MSTELLFWIGLFVFVVAVLQIDKSIDRLADILRDRPPERR